MEGHLIIGLHNVIVEQKERGLISVILVIFGFFI